MPHLFTIAAVVGAVHLMTRKQRRIRKQNRQAGAVGSCSQCGKRAQLQIRQGMVGACCSSCAHGASCETEDTGASDVADAADRRHQFWDKYHRTAPVGSRFRRRY